VYAGFFMLGIYDHLTPGLASEVCLIATIVASFQEASRVMQERGVPIDAKKICEIARRYARRAEFAKQNSSALGAESLAGRRVVISTDGGRIRIRKKKRGPKTEKGRHRYTTKWREPKLLIVYTVNADGKKDASFLPVIEGTMKGPDAVFGLIKFYLKQLAITKAEKILFVADGARWIWNRVPELVKALGIAITQIYTLVDFFHAVEHLVKIADLRTGWKKSERNKWVKKHRRFLLHGKIAEVISSICTICRGRKSKKLTTEKNYFVRNKSRMKYDAISSMGLPIGSGAMESAIRRVVNLRLKGASIYWLEETAEAMLLLRSFYKSGRWDMLNKHAHSISYDALS
jgi:hypothetical protein